MVGNADCLGKSGTGPGVWMYIEFNFGRHADVTFFATPRKYPATAAARAWGCSTVELAPMPKNGTTIRSHAELPFAEPVPAGFAHPFVFFHSGIYPQGASTCDWRRKIAPDGPVRRHAGTPGPSFRFFTLKKRRRSREFGHVPVRRFQVSHPFSAGSDL